MKFSRQLKLANRPMIIVPCSYKVPECAEQHSEAPDQARPIHIHRSDLRRLGPEREEKGKNSVHKTNNVGQSSPSAQSPWSVPDGFVKIPAPED